MIKKMAKKRKKNKRSIYEHMVESLAIFVIRTAEKDNPTPSELNAMIEATKALFRTI